MNGNVIEAKGLRKLYGSFAAVDGIDLTVKKGETFGLLGPNGAGKTTTILMLMGLTEATAGELRVMGLDPQRDPLAVKRHVGYLPDSVGFYDNLTVAENLRYSCRLAGLPRAEIEPRISEALTQVGLADAAGRRAGALSHGMRQRLGLADVLLRRPALAILDEPTSGLDPQSSLDFLELIRSLKAGGVTVLLSSHLLDRVQAVCDRVALFHRGRIVLSGSVAELAHQVLGAGFGFEVTVAGPDPAPRLSAIPGVRHVTGLGNGAFRVSAARELRAEAAQAVVASGGALLRLASTEPSLEAVYRGYFEGQHGQA
ncbi:MAG TPA: ABC transporter ATP-binding protein [Dongiaceae bacterium]|nr:ABC transporter ATP-binding protein [Dongiaceae bacterium]